MASPITWQNIYGPQNVDPARLLEASQRSFGGAFGQLGDLLKEREAIDASNVVAQRASNTQNFLDQLASIGKTPEQLAGAIQSGQVDQMRSAYGPNIDRAATRGAAENLLNTRYAQTQAAQQFGDTQLTRQEQPILDVIQSKIAQGTATPEEIAAASVRSRAPLYQALDTRKQAEIGRGRDTTLFERGTEKFGLEKQKFADDLLTNQAQRAHLAAADRELSARNDILKLDKEDKLAARLASNKKGVRDQAEYDAFIKGTPLDAGTLDTEAGKQTFYKALKDIGVSDKQRADILYNLDKQFKDGVTIGEDAKGKPIKVPLPVSVAVDAVQGSSDNPFAIGFSRRGDDFANILRGRFGMTDEGKLDPNQKSTSDRDLTGFLSAAAAKRAEREARVMGDSAPSPVSTLRSALRPKPADSMPPAMSNKIGDTTRANGQDWVYTSDGWTPKHLVPKKK